MDLRKFICHKCGSTGVTIKWLDYGPHYGAANCADCGRWIKWLKKEYFSDLLKALTVSQKTEKTGGKGE